MSKTGPQTGPKSVQKAHFVAWQNLAPARARAKKAGSLNPRSITPGQDPAVDAWLAMMTDGLLGGLFGGGGGKGSWKSDYFRHYEPVVRLELPASEHPVGDCEQMFLAMNGEGLNAKNSSHEKDWREFPDLQILCDREFGPRSLSTGDLVSIHLDSQNCHFFRVAVIGFVEVTDVPGDLLAVQLQKLRNMCPEKPASNLVEQLQKPRNLVEQQVWDDLPARAASRREAGAAGGSSSSGAAGPKKAGKASPKKAGGSCSSGGKSPVRK